MNINELVPSFETCERAKELGFPQKTFFFYGADKHIKTNGKTGYMLYNKMQNIEELNGVSAPTLQEVIAELPGEILKDKTLYLPFITKVKDKNGNVIYTTAYCSEWEALNDSYNFNNANPTQAALELWIKLRKDGVI